MGSAYELAEMVSAVSFRDDLDPSVEARCNVVSQALGLCYLQ